MRKVVEDTTYMEHLEIVDELDCTKIKNWYIEAYPTDKVGHFLRDNATFMGLLTVLVTGNDVYDYVGEADSVIRERIFDKLSDITGMTYDEVYDLWMRKGA